MEVDVWLRRGTAGGPWGNTDTPPTGGGLGAEDEGRGEGGRGKGGGRKGTRTKEFESVK